MDTQTATGITIIILFWIVPSLLIARLASSRGRRAGFWFFISIVTSPVLGLLLVLMMPSLRKQAA